MEVVVESRLDRSARLIGKRVMRPATRLITPWWRSSTPRTRKRGRTAGHRPEPLPHPFAADHVDEPGLVLEVQEHRALRGRGLLAVCHHSRHLDDGAVGEHAQVAPR